MSTRAHVWRQVLDLGRAQRGLVARRQARALGLPGSTWDDRVREEGWERPFRTVAALPGCEVDASVRARAAALAIGPAAAVTARSALHLDGVVDTPSVSVQLVVPACCQPRPLTGVEVTRSRTITARDVRVDAGVAVATVPRAFLDAAASTSRERLRDWLVDARQRRIVDVAAVSAFAARTTNSRGRGRLLAACTDVADSGADSALVAEVESRLRRAGFVLDVPPRTVPAGSRVLHPDITIARRRVAIEVDGYGSHASRRALDLDQRKHNAYALAGWVVLRISWTRIADDWDGFLDELLRAVGGRPG